MNQQVGRYQIVEELGRGAMAVVYKALDPAIGRTVAIKTIRLSAFSDMGERQRVRERLLREAQSAGLLSHPNIITIYDVLEQEDFAYIFMEYVNGSSLEKMIREGSLPGSSALMDFLRQVSDALDYAHRKGIVHRDIKPANVIIAKSGPGTESIAKIADFGVAKFISHEMTHSGTMIGTPSYMSPEQIQGLTVDARSDQFSLAVVVYELLTGQKPFAAENLPALFYQVCKQDARPAQELNASLNETVGKVLRRAMSKEPAERFVGCGDFIGALHIALGECPDWAPIPRAIAAGEGTKQTAGAVAGDRVAGQFATAVIEQRATRAAPGSSGSSAVLVRSGAQKGWSGVAPAVAEETSHNLPPIQRRRVHDFDDADETFRPRSSALSKAVLILALCFAVAAAIVFIVRWNSGPPLPQQVADTSSAPATPPPEESAQNTSKRPSAETRHDAQSTAPAASNTGTDTGKPEEKQPAVLGDMTPSRQITPTLPLPAPPAPKPEGGVADVDLISEPPGAKVVIDNSPKYVCISPCTISLPDGRHTLTAELAGFSLLRKILTVPDDRSVWLALSKNTGVVEVTSMPSGSEVFVDGQSKGPTPVTLHLPAGLHRIRLVYGSKQHEETVEVEPDVLQPITFKWE